MRKQNAYMTIVLVLCMALLLSFCLVLIESVRQNAGRLETECVTDVAMQSVLAEFHRGMMEQYDLFVIDSSYGTEAYGKGKIEERLGYYLDQNLDYQQVFLSGLLYRDFLKLHAEEREVTRVSYITDGRGAVFRQCAVDAVRADAGLELLEQLQDWMQTIEVNGLESSDVAEQKAKVDAELAEQDGNYVETEKNVWEKVTVNNPTDSLEGKRRMGILKLVTEEKELSGLVLSEEGLIGHRMQEGLVQPGDMGLAKEAAGENEQESLTDKFLFREYLLRYMGHYGKENAEDALKYQVEYLVAGENSDVENLRKVANRICVIREAANTIYLLGSESKREQIHLLAQVLSAVIPLPGITSLMEAAILLGWGYAESVYDVRTLLAGGGIPLMKDDAAWHCGLASALWGSWQGIGEEESGMHYEDYLRVFLMMKDSDELTNRAMNLVEADMRTIPGNESFCLDSCVVAFEAEVVFESAYGYRYEYIREKRYK